MVINLDEDKPLVEKRAPLMSSMAESGESTSQGRTYYAIHNSSNIFQLLFILRSLHQVIQKQPTQIDFLLILTFKMCLKLPKLH
jgi:hypothetical protein